MHFLKKDGVSLAFEDTGTKLPSMILVHGCGFDHSSLAPQLEFFRDSHRVIAADLRGHGRSYAPKQDYTMAGFADDLAWLAAELELVKPVLVGHSMGGNVALELAARYPEALSGLVMIDSSMLAPREQLDSVQPLAEALRRPDYLSAYRDALTQLCLPTDRHSPRMISSMQVPQHVLASAWPNHVINYDAAPAAAGCHAPVAYIGATMPFLDLPRFQALTPQLIVAHTLGSGHFSPIEAPDQINAMIAHFIRISALG